jgi:hypothetical protein
MTNLPFGMMETLVAHHQRELQDFASRRRLLRRRSFDTTEPAVEARVFRDIPPQVAESGAAAAA